MKLEKDILFLKDQLKKQTEDDDLNIKEFNDVISEEEEQPKER